MTGIGPGAAPAKVSAIELANNPTALQLVLHVDQDRWRLDDVAPIVTVAPGPHLVSVTASGLDRRPGLHRMKKFAAGDLTTKVIEIDVQSGFVATLEMDLAWGGDVCLHQVGLRPLTTEDVAISGRLANYQKHSFGYPRLVDYALPSGPPVQGLVPPPEAAEGSGWYADPTGRHQYRWFDGTAWSVFVDDNGVTDAEPV